MALKSPYETSLAQAEAELQRRERDQRAAQEAIYDWYGGVCPCGKEPGHCRLHPRARGKQRPPDRAWRYWMLLAGRGGGKTISGAKYVNNQVDKHAVNEIVLINATIGDTRDVMVLGRSGLVETSPPWCKAHYLPSRSQVEWRDAAGKFLAMAYMRTAEVPDGLRGLNASLVWCDEPGKWEKQAETWMQVGMIMRNKVDPPPRCVLTGTPTPTDLIYEVEEMASREREVPGSTKTFLVQWSTTENAEHLDADYVGEMVEKYGGTLKGEEEIGGQIVRRRQGALWMPDDFTRTNFRILEPPEDLEYIGVAIDPASGSKDQPNASEAGIVVGGRRRQQRNSYVSRGVVLADRSTGGNPSDWSKAVVRAYYDFGANEVIAEGNQGGEMVRQVIEAVPADGGYPSGKNIPIRMVFASVGKMARAEPIQVLYQSGRIQHVKGGLEILERQMIQYLPGRSGQKLDRVDALVWMLTGAIIDFDDITDTGPIVVTSTRDPLGYEGTRLPWTDR